MLSSWLNLSSGQITVPASGMGQLLPFFPQHQEVVTYLFIRQTRWKVNVYTHKKDSRTSSVKIDLTCGCTVKASIDQQLTQGGFSERRYNPVMHKLILAGKTSFPTMGKGDWSGYHSSFLGHISSQQKSLKQKLKKRETIKMLLNISLIHI